MHHLRVTAGCGVEFSAEDLAQQLGDLRYDALAQHLRALSTKLGQDSDADGERGRAQLAAHLYDAALHIGMAVESVVNAWKICEPHMTKKET